ncbi:NAD(P)H-dependent oxidoreductase [Piscinibacter sp. XHJ-5]|uniref:NADPH-dependent FMN reductase n=1 Tax=Piscinibacter sp. XHJ-5 TaxID=3037797 RepID=UPI0024530CEC|nr:NAD(P)H-dependent oxidoreductase [Piscinibacter sp. XHJ-5]
MDHPIRLALVLGSTRDGRFCDTVARWAVGQIERRPEFALDVIDLMHTEPSEAGVRIAAVDGVLIVVPEYNHGYPAPLKRLIDSSSEPWLAKPVAFVSYGGQSGGIRAVEQLRQVFVEVHAMTIREQVAFAHAREQFDAEGRLLAPDRAERAIAVMLTRLSWWAVALRDARRAAPYDRVIA